MNVASDPAIRSVILLLVMSLILAGCGTTPRQSDSRYQLDQDRGPSGDYDISNLRDATPRFEEPRRAGNMASYEVWGKQYRVLNSNDGYLERGIASWYGEKFHGHKTSNGETFDMYAMSAAHKSLRIPSYARVTNLDNGRSVVVRVNDRGPFHDDRLIDLSYAAAKKLGYQGRGTARVEVAAITVHPDGAMTLAGQPWSSNSTEPRQPKSDAGTSVGGEEGHFVQLASFGSRSPAEQLLNRVRAVTEDPARVRAISTGNGRYHRVQVGPFANERDARQAQGRLENLGFGKSILLTDNH